MISFFIFVNRVWGYDWTSFLKKMLPINGGGGGGGGSSFPSISLLIGYATEKTEQIFFKTGFVSLQNS